MKKFFLLTAAFVAASAGFAQKFVTVDEPVKMGSIGTPAVKVASEGEKVAISSNGLAVFPTQKTAATGLYYNRPEGSFYYGWDIDGGGYYYSALVVAPWTDFTYVNKSTNPTEVSWFLNFPKINDAGTAYEGYDEKDMTQYADETGNYTASLDPGYYSVAPTIKYGEEEFTLSEGNTNWIKDGVKTAGRETKVFTNDDLYSMSIVDHNNGWYYGTGSLSTKYFWGTGTVTRNFGTSDAPDNKVGVCYAVRQQYEKPMSPLYVEQMFIRANTTSETPIPAGKELTLYIVNSETNKVTEVFTATADNVSGMRAGGLGKTFQLGFTKKVETPLGVMTSPIVIDYPFFVQIEGFDEEGVDVGLYGNDIADGDNVENAYFLVDYGKDSEGKDQVLRHYYTGLGLPLCFQALFDGITVWETATSSGQTLENFNAVKVTADGTTCTNYAASSIPGAVVETATPWFDEDNTEMYFKAEDAPEWVNLNAVYNESLEAYVVSVTCDALPAGVNGRSAEVYIEGRGVTSAAPIVVVQGDADLPSSGIGVTVADKANDADAAVYNLNGQRVSKNAKGILIQNGKKYIKK